ncbi:MAG TPA: phosphate ABC transporter substrate-binding protein [Bacteroidia bacterium]|jgi:phosphate transport system substrate-binding protein|nr:phosphate ABC transporter substrate-binding protein [Bacteroidia bacterium]
MNIFRSTGLFLAGISIFVIVLVFSVVFVTACKMNKQETAQTKIILKGSETELPLITNFGYEYEEKKTATISVSGGGSNAGISELMDGKIDIANSSRIITDEEKNTLAKKNVKWMQAIVSVDAIAIITHPSLHIENISLDQLSAIFSGKITNWIQIGGPYRPINPYGRGPSSGTHDFMKHRLHIDAFRPQMKEFDTYSEILNAVKNDSNAIAYVSSSCITQNVSKASTSVFVMKVFIDNALDYSPFDEEAINTGDYALIRPLFQYYNAANPNPEIKKFIQFEISQRGQGLLKLYGYYRINVFHKQINSLNGF